MTSIERVQEQVQEVRQVMVENIDRLLQRSERLDVVGEKTLLLRENAQRFQRQGQFTRRTFSRQHWKVVLVCCGAAAVGGLVIYFAWRS